MKSNRKNTAEEQKVKKKSQFMRIIILAFVFCAMVVTALVFSDVLFSDGDEEPKETVLVAVSVFSDRLMLDSDREVTISELREHLESLRASGSPFVGSIINDMANPADVTLYNQVVDLFAEFDIFCEKLSEPSTYDEVLSATQNGE